MLTHLGGAHTAGHYVVTSPPPSDAQTEGAPRVWCFDELHGRHPFSLSGQPDQTQARPSLVLCRQIERPPPAAPQPGVPPDLQSFLTNTLRCTASEAQLLMGHAATPGPQGHIEREQPRGDVDAAVAPEALSPDDAAASHMEGGSSVSPPPAPVLGGRSSFSVLPASCLPGQE